MNEKRNLKCQQTKLQENFKITILELNTLEYSFLF